jgi:hypothetical protein
VICPSKSQIRFNGWATRLSRRLGNHCTRAPTPHPTIAHLEACMAQHPHESCAQPAHHPFTLRGSIAFDPEAKILFGHSFILFLLYYFTSVLLKSSALSVQFFGHRSAAQFPRHAPFKQGSPPSVRDSGSDLCSIMQTVPASIRHQYTYTCSPCTAFKPRI